MHRLSPLPPYLALAGLLIFIVREPALAAAPPTPTPPAPAKPTYVVVIDPGHGGADFGAVFNNGKVRVAEKTVTLALAEEAARQIRLRGMRAVLTRAKDVSLSLQARTQAANKLKADVFLSIHMNSTHTPMVSEAEGVETYILNNTSDATTKRLAHFENSVLGGSPIPLDELGREQSDVALILKDLRLEANGPESKRLACAVQERLAVATGNKNRGIRQALFYVLLGADMPSILIEAGFITNPRDRAKVLSVKGRAAIGIGIADAVDAFRRTRGTAAANAELTRCKVR